MEGGNNVIILYSQKLKEIIKCMYKKEKSYGMGMEELALCPLESLVGFWIQRNLVTAEMWGSIVFFNVLGLSVDTQGRFIMQSL